VLRETLPDTAMVLEIASGTGEHAVHCAQAMPGWTWQPSDANAEACLSIAAWRAEAGLANVRPPVQLDVCHWPWPVITADALVCINMVHISPWHASVALFAGAAAILPPNGIFFLYGPYLRNDVVTSAGNLAFDASLRSRDPAWGLREVAAMDALALEHGLSRDRLVEMPANNIALVYRRAA